MHAEAISETFNPAQTGGMVVDADEVSVWLVIYICTDLQELAARAADIRLLGGAL